MNNTGKIVWHQEALGKSFATQADFDKHARQLGQQPMRVMLSDVQLGLYETAPNPCGKYKQFWVMRLRRLPGRNQLPRGFSKKPLFV